jgi:hypothetical protein
MLFEDQVEWALKTFPHQTTVGVLNHLKKEVDECLANRQDIEEYADVLLLLFTALGREGFTVRDLAEAAFAKLEKNKLRKWRQWIFEVPYEAGGNWVCVAYPEGLKARYLMSKHTILALATADIVRQVGDSPNYHLKETDASS